MRVLVAGATSRVGRALSRDLVSAGHSVRAMSRTGASVGAQEAVAADVLRPESLGVAVDGVDAVISLIGAPLWPVPRPGRETTFEATDRDGNIALFTAAQAARVRRVVYLSVFGEYPQGLGYVDSHRAVEAWLARSGLPHAVVRPTGFFGSFDLFGALGRARLGVCVGAGTARTNPIHEEDLATVLASGLHEEGVIACGGPDVLSRREIAELALAGARAPVAPVPPALLLAQAAAARVVSRRVSDVLRFIHHISLHDAVAPMRGSRRLQDYLRRA